MDGHVLVVDDDPTNRAVLKQVLEAMSYRVSVAEDGAAALQVLAFERFDVLLLDLHMPRQSGLDVLRQIREFDGPNINTPAICVSADVLTRRPDEYLDLGFHAFLSKPVALAKLALALKEATSQQDDELQQVRLTAKLHALKSRMASRS